MPQGGGTRACSGRPEKEPILIFDFPPYELREIPKPRTKRDYQKGGRLMKGRREKEMRRSPAHAGFIASAPDKVWHVAQLMTYFVEQNASGIRRCLLEISIYRFFI